MTTEITALGEREILALAISLEEEDVRIYRDLAEKVRARFSGVASILDSMQEEESSHRDRLHDFYVPRFGKHIPYIRRYDIKGFVKRRPLWLQPAITPRQVLSFVLAMEAETRRYYQDAANHATSEDVRTLLSDLAGAEEDHVDRLAAEVKQQRYPPISLRD
jgi:erythrin-vacuolar iron transport family protein